MNVEDPNVWMSRFSQETWKGFIESRRPTQVVCNLAEAVEGRACHEIDVRSCRLNGICEGNVEDIPIFSPLDELVKAKEGVLYDYQWVDIGHVRSPLKSYIYDGPRWYDKATTKFMLETGVCKWRHISLGFEATSHRSAGELSSTLRKLRVLWFEVGKSDQAEVFLSGVSGVSGVGEKKQNALMSLLKARPDKKNRSELLSKTALLSLLGGLGTHREL